MGVQIQGDTGNVIATKGTYSGNVTIGGTLTYEDVTNIDSVGLITARQGIEVGASPGVGASISVDGNAEFAGIVTATTFKGDGSQLSNITSTTINNNADNRVITGSGSANTLEGESTLTFTNTGSAGQLNLKRSTSSNQEAIFAYGSSNLEIETRESTGIKFKTNQSDRVSIAASTGFMTNVNPIFNVRPTSGYQVLSNQTNTKIVFAENIDGFTERGGGFDFTNNRFVVPLDGYYHFSYIVYYYIVSEARVAIYKNGSRVHINMGVVLNSEVNPHQVSGSYSLLLDKGDYIELYGYVNGSSTTRIWSSGATWNETSFMGHLIG